MKHAASQQSQATTITSPTLRREWVRSVHFNTRLHQANNLV